MNIKKVVRIFFFLVLSLVFLGLGMSFSLGVILAIFAHFSGYIILVLIILLGVLVLVY